jgi:large conductance mechanosensitive channel
MLSGFKQFILRGNVVIIALLVGKPDFTGISFAIRGTVFPIGDFITAVVSFLLVAGTVYFFVVTPINALIARTRKDPVPADPTTKKCPECLSEIPIDARRCSHCAEPVMGKAA